MKHIVLQPTFYNKFECIGSDCKYNCCREWEIGFKKQELKNIKRKIHTEEFRELFRDAFEKKKNDDFIYKIKLNENRKCKFLDENGLCKIYQEVGPENMSMICQIFPRSITNYIGKYECFLEISCGEVVKLLLEEKEGIQLEVIERELSSAEKAAAVLIDTERIKKQPISDCLTEIKILLLGVLQNREYAFGERMVVLGLAMRKVDEMAKKRDFKGIKSYIQQFVKDFNDNKEKELYSKLFENVNKNGEKRAFESIGHYLLTTNTNSSIAEMKKKIMDRIEIKMSLEEDDKLDLEYNIEKYQNAIKGFEEFIKGKEYFIENVMIEGYLSARFPFRVEGGIWRNYCAMALIYSIMLFMWTCLIEKDSEEEDFIYYTSEIARSLLHNDLRMTLLEEQLNKTESETLAHMAVLVL